MSKSKTNERIFVFKQYSKEVNPRRHAFPESKIEHIECHFEDGRFVVSINGVSVDGDFATIVELLGERVNVS